MTATPAEPRYARARLLGGTTRLMANELPHEPPAAIGAAILSARGIHRYPDPTYAQLVGAVAEDLRVGHEHLMLGAGSSSILQRLITVLCPAKGDAVMWAAPEFSAFGVFARQAGAAAQRVPLSPDGAVDLEAMLRAITPATRVIILVTPHNPTGLALAGDALRAFLRQVGDGVTVVLDEAYREFCDDGAVADGVELAKAQWAMGRQNLVVVRTFSKAYGLAGMRVGYGIAPAPLARAVWDAAVPREIALPSAVAAVAALKAKSAMQENAAHVIHERARVLAELRRIGYTPPPSQGNFVWLPLGEDSGRFTRHCFDDGVLVLDVADRGVRVSIGNPSGNDAFLRTAHTWVTGRAGTPPAQTGTSRRAPV